MGPKAQINSAGFAATAQPLGAFDLELLQQTTGIQQFKVRV